MPAVVPNPGNETFAFHVDALAMYESAIAEPFHVPAVMVPRAARLVDPAHVESAVFSTLPRPTSPAVNVITPVRPATESTGAAAAAALAKSEMSELVSVIAPVRPATDVTGDAASTAFEKSARSAVVSVTAPIRPATLTTASVLSTFCHDAPSLMIQSPTSNEIPNCVPAVLVT
ncbi:MAG: hypothetical protein BWY91_01387 [bacterium ADurb.BinA028]|nr:MAG: hypothetical protein BWY91_01387 [bacterium ADurb.BinA028]